MTNSIDLSKTIDAFTFKICLAINLILFTFEGAHTIFIYKISSLALTFQRFFVVLWTNRASHTISFCCIIILWATNTISIKQAKSINANTAFRCSWINWIRPTYNWTIFCILVPKGTWSASGTNSWIICKSC